ncbi:hypothetical protein EYF80_040676 [Liparis tanakae]|uniref:Uncharacterized protein n=1 Tax=Liparis tanakae TaxID=230148 RepID=A0A4Z2G8J4_9TELE|nr:hypothetical protein EYF80_040676 [Liparis tanakae]
MLPTLRHRNTLREPGQTVAPSYLSPVMVMVKPSYSFPGSFTLGTLELTVKPSLVLLLNCFRK